MSKIPENSQFKMSSDFSNRIKELIDDNYFTSKKDFAKFVGVSIPVISKAVIYGIIPSTRILIRIADKLEVSIKYLIALEDKNEFIPSANPTTFYDRLAELTKAEDKLNYGKLASKTSFNRTYIYEWCNEKTLPSLDFLFEIADYFKVSPDYLLGRTDYRI